MAGPAPTATSYASATSEASGGYSPNGGGSWSTSTPLAAFGPPIAEGQGWCLRGTTLLYEEAHLEALPEGERAPWLNSLRACMPTTSPPLAIQPVRGSLRAPAEAPTDASAAAPVAGGPTGPITSWAAVARAADVSLDTLSRRRKAWGWTQPPYFETVAEARAWYRRGESGKHARTSLATTKASTRRSGTSGTAGTTLADLKADRSKGRGTK
jgi:hypothetical protein